MLSDVNSDTTKYSSENDSDLANPPELPELLEEDNVGNPNEDSLSPDDFLDEIEDIATIKFRTQENEIFTKACKRSSTIGNIKMELSALFSIPTTQMAVSNAARVLSDDDILADLGVPAMGILELGIQIEKPYCLNRDVIYGHIPNIDVIVVRANGYDLIVEIENRCRRKDWLGGYRHKVTNKHYHHAWTQTSSILEGKLTSSTQTIYGLSKHTNTPKAKTTQTSSIPSLTDKIVEAGIYLPYVEDVESSSTKLMTPEAHLTQSPVAPQVHCTATVAQNKFMAVASQLRALYREIKKWNQAENKKLENCDEKSRPTRRVEVLNRTRMILLRIGRQRRQLLQQMNQEAEEKQLSEAAKPKLFVCATGEKIEIDTLSCQEARELCQLYEEYTRKASVEEQMKAIVNLQAFFAHKNAFEFSKHVVDLLQRDLDIVTYRLECIPSLKARIERFVFYYLQLMASDGGAKSVPVTAAESSRQYRAMLTRLQNDEMNRFRCFTSVAFQMEVADIRHLVGSIWKNCSAMDECQDLDQLRLTRWQKNVEWSPWNCILLRKHEIKDHLRANSLEEKYDRCFISKIRNKHLQAKIYFNEISSFHEWFHGSE